MKNFRFIFQGTISERYMKQLLSGEINGIEINAMDDRKGRFELVKEKCDKCGQEIKESNPSEKE